MQQESRRLIPVLNYRSSLLHVLCAKAGEQAAVLEKIQAVLPEDLQPHVLHCVIRLKTLTVFTGSATWATAMRFYGQTMLDAVNNRQSLTLSTVRVKVLPEIGAEKSGRKAVLPSSDTVAVLMAQGKTVADPQLKASLLRLGATLSRLQQKN